MQHIKTLLTSLLLCWAVPAQATIAFINSVSAASGGIVDNVTTAASNMTGANFEIIGIVNDGLKPSCLVSDSSSLTWVPLTRIVPNYTTVHGAVQFFYAQNITGGAAQTFTMSSTTTGDCDASVITVFGFSGVAASATDGQNGSSNSALGTTIQPGSITPSQTADVSITVVSNEVTTSTMSISGSYSSPTGVNFSAGNNYGGHISYFIKSNSTAENPTWTASLSDGLTAALALFKSASVPPSATTGFLPASIP